MAKRTVEIDNSLYAKAEAVAKESGYANLSELIEEMLKELVKDSEVSEVSKDDKKEIEERLRKLGYMD